MKHINIEAWTATWQAPVVTSFGTAQLDGIDGPALEFWRRQTEGRIDWLVDLACGNGALSWLFNDILNRDSRRTWITGIDLADIAPFEILDRAEQDYPAVRFIGNTALERLPFGDACVDLAVSQYGIEYSRLTLSIPEVARILKPGGRLAFILHDRDGALVREAVSPLTDYRMILHEIDAPGIILELGHLYQSADGGPQNPVTAGEYRRLIERLDKTTEVFVALNQRKPDLHPVLVYKSKLNEAFREAHKPQVHRKFDLSAFLGEARDALRDNILRLEQLAAVAPDEGARQRLCALLEQQGLTVTEIGPLHHSSGLVWGSTLTARR